MPNDWEAAQRPTGVQKRDGGTARVVAHEGLTVGDDKEEVLGYTFSH